MVVGGGRELEAEHVFGVEVVWGGVDGGVEGFGEVGFVDVGAEEDELCDGGFGVEPFVVGELVVGADFLEEEFLFVAF